jgi:hypothetical protein
MAKYWTKAQAVAIMVNEYGYTEHYQTGSCGDGAYGTRLYFKSPEAELNEFGAPITRNGYISKVKGGWVCSNMDPNWLD